MEYFKLSNEFIEPKDSYNIISVSLFRLKNSYKNSNIYYEGLNLLVNNFPKILPNFYLRIYYDTSVLENDDENMIDDTKNLWIPYFKILRKNPKIQLIKYNSDEFRVDKIYHDGLIGTFMRFIPFFNLEINKKINTVAVMDIDINLKKMYQIFDVKKKIAVMNKTNSNISFTTYPCYELWPRYQNMRKYVKIHDIIPAGTIITRVKFPIKIFNNFINSIVNNDKIITDYVENYYLNNEVSVKKEFDQNKMIKFRVPYGLDEYFLMFVNEYINNKKIKNVIKYEHDSFKTFLNPIHELYLEKKIDARFFKSFVKNIMGEVYDNEKTISENFENLVKILRKYNFYEDKKYLQMFINLKNIIIKLIKTNKYKKIGIEDVNDFNCIINIPEFSKEMYYVKNDTKK